MNPTPVTTTEMIIKISSSSNLSFPNPVIVWCVGAIVLLGAVILLLGKISVDSNVWSCMHKTRVKKVF